MSKKKYNCNWPLNHDQKTYTDTVNLTAAEAEPLLAVGAISLPSKAKAASTAEVEAAAAAEAEAATAAEAGDGVTDD